MNDQTRKAWEAYKGKKNNAQGHFFEGFIKTACTIYKQKGTACVEKMPEPFMVLEKRDRGIFKGRFIAHAQPDFMGTLYGGRAICFEAKYTSTDKLGQAVLTGEQWNSLEQHWMAGALAGVCVGIKQVYAFVPWIVWRSMQAIYGRKYMTAEDLEPYRVKFNGACMFLDPINPELVERAKEAAARTVAEGTWGRKLAEMAEIERLELNLRKVAEPETAARLIAIIRQQPEEKWAAFLETTAKAIMGGADYSACESLDDMGNVWARYFIESVGGL